MFNHTAQKGVNIRIISASGKKSNHRKGGAVLMEFVGRCVFIHLIFFSLSLVTCWEVMWTPPSICQCFIV